MRQIIQVFMVIVSLFNSIFGMKYPTAETVAQNLGKNYGDYVSLKMHTNKSKTKINAAIKKLEKDLIDSLFWKIEPLDEISYFTTSKIRQTAHKKFEYTKKKISPLMIAANISYQKYFVVLHCFKPSFLYQLEKTIKDLINDMIVGEKKLSQFYIKQAYKD